MIISVEFAHTMLEPVFEAELARSAEVARAVASHLTSAGHDVQLVVLLDDKRTPAGEREGLAGPVLKQLLSQVPDLRGYCFERDLMPHAEELEASLPPGRAKDLHRTVNYYARKYAKLPCSVDISLWHLIRIGALPGFVDLIRPITPESPPVNIADLAVSLLGDQHEEHEEMAQKKYLRHIRGGQYLNQIVPVYYPDETTIAMHIPDLIRALDDTLKEYVCPRS